MISNKSNSKKTILMKYDCENYLFIYFFTHFHSETFNCNTCPLGILLILIKPSFENQFHLEKCQALVEDKIVNEIRLAFMEGCHRTAVYAYSFVKLGFSY